MHIYADNRYDFVLGILILRLRIFSKFFEELEKICNFSEKFFKKYKILFSLVVKMEFSS